MSDGSVGPRQEYWRPVKPTLVGVARSSAPRVECPACGVDYASGARFCYLCGKGLDEQAIAERAVQATNHSGVSPLSLAFFLLAVGCTVAAIAVGYFYAPDTLIGWHVVQLRRIDWLLGAIASLLAGLLFKK